MTSYIGLYWNNACPNGQLPGGYVFILAAPIRICNGDDALNMLRGLGWWVCEWRMSCEIEA
jgi:hypothetical protein